MPLYDRDALIEAWRRDEAPPFLLFYGHTAKPGRVTAACFSQWYASPFEADGVRYATAEHYMMAGKARLFRDEAHLEAILASTDPAEAKALGRQVQGFDAETWEAHGFDIVVAGNVAKFGTNPALRAFLLGTGDQVLVEAAPRDRVWGIGLGRNNPAASDPTAWRGSNLLGFALMVARDRIRETAPRS
jgi:ribA/ribD-fused uncharacterized protein